MTPLRKRLLLLFVVGISLLAICIYLAGKGKLIGAILLFPSYLLVYPYNDTLAGVLGTVQFPLYYYVSTFGKTKKSRLLIILITILAHLLMVNAVITP